MKIALLGPANSIHLIRIANELIKKGLCVLIISLPNHKARQENVNAEVIYLKHGGTKGYYSNFKQVKRILVDNRIDILNAHYASGYGTLGRLSNFHPTILSVWGSDIFSFPNENWLKKRILVKNLLFADEIFSTSICMAEEIKKYIGVQRRIVITPFGVDLNLFKPEDKTNTDEITIGFLKGTDPIYGIDLFVKAFKLLSDWITAEDICLKGIICGNEKYQEKLYEQIKELNLDNEITFFGEVQHNKMPIIINKCDLICIPSREESFGVAAIESLACGVPCITSDAPGLKEVMEDGVTGFVASCNEQSLAEKMKELILNNKERAQLGNNGRKRVEEMYDFSENITIFKREFEKLTELTAINNIAKKVIFTRKE